MDEKMKMAMMKLKAAVMELDACCGGPDVKHEEMPEQEEMAEEGDYKGKGMMSEPPNLKKGIAMAMMKKKGY